MKLKTILTGAILSIAAILWVVFSLFTKTPRVNAQVGVGGDEDTPKVVPVVTISLDHNYIVVGQSVNITWVTDENTNKGDSCTAYTGQNVPGKLWSGSRDGTPGSHSEALGPFNDTGNYDFSIICSGPDGDSAPVTASLQVGDFSLTCQPASITLSAGDSSAVEVQLQGINGFGGTVNYQSPELNVNVQNPPTLDPLKPESQNPDDTDSLTPATGMITTTTDTDPGEYIINYSGQYQAEDKSILTHSCVVYLTVESVAQDYTLSCTPVLAGVAQGDSATFNLTATPENGLTGEVIWSESISPGPKEVTTPVITYYNNPQNLGKDVTEAVFATDETTTVTTFTITFTAEYVGGGISHQCSVQMEVYNPPPPAPVNVVASNANLCGQIAISWSKSPASNDSNPIAGFRVYRRTQGTGNGTDNWTQLGDDVLVQKEINYEVIDSAPLLLNGSNYYGVTAFGTQNDRESEIAAADPASIVPLSCSPDLSSSDLDVHQVQGKISQSFKDEPCSGVSEPAILPNQSLYSPEDLVTFKINICNSGGAGLSNVDAKTTLSNLIFQKVTETSPDGCAKLENNNDTWLDFWVNDLAEPNNANATICSITYTALVRNNSKETASVYRFQSVTDLSGTDPDGKEVTKRIFTPPYLLRVSGNQPDRSETSPQ